MRWDGVRIGIEMGIRMGWVGVGVVLVDAEVVVGLRIGKGCEWDVGGD